MNLLDNALRLVQEADARRLPPTEAKNVTTAQLLPALAFRPADGQGVGQRPRHQGGPQGVGNRVRLHQSALPGGRLGALVRGRRQRDGEWERELGHPLEELLANPNPYMSGQDLFERLIQHLGLAGNGLWTMITVTSLRGGTTPVELWPIDPGPIKPIPSRAEFISGYEYQRNGERVVIPAEQVIHFALSDPGNPYWGMSPLQAVARQVDTEVAAMRWNLFAFDNRAIPDGMLTFDHPLNREDWESARDRDPEGTGRAEQCPPNAGARERC